MDLDQWPNLMVRGRQMDRKINPQGSEDNLQVTHILVTLFF